MSHTCWCCSQFLERFTTQCFRCGAAFPVGYSDSDSGHNPLYNVSSQGGYPPQGLGTPVFGRGRGVYGAQNQTNPWLLQQSHHHHPYNQQGHYPRSHVGSHGRSTQIVPHGTQPQNMASPPANWEQFADSSPNPQRSQNPSNRSQNTQITQYNNPPQISQGHSAEYQGTHSTSHSTPPQNMASPPANWEQFADSSPNPQGSQNPANCSDSPQNPDWVKSEDARSRTDITIHRPPDTQLTNLDSPAENNLNQSPDAKSPGSSTSTCSSPEKMSDAERLSVPLKVAEPGTIFDTTTSERTSGKTKPMDETSTSDDQSLPPDKPTDPEDSKPGMDSSTGNSTEPDVENSAASAGGANPNKSSQDSRGSSPEAGQTGDTTEKRKVEDGQDSTVNQTQPEGKRKKEEENQMVFGEQEGYNKNKNPAPEYVPRTTRSKTSKDFKTEEKILVNFWVVVSPEFKMNLNEDTVFVKFGHQELGGFDKDSNVNWPMHRMGHLDESKEYKMMTAAVPIRKNLLGGDQKLRYKYVV